MLLMFDAIFVVFVFLFSCSFGYGCRQRYNIHYIDYGVLLFISGNTVQILDLFQLQNKKVKRKKKNIY